MADDMEYLQPSFDPSSLTMPRLRNILMTHDISYPASAKKAELVAIFNQDLKPKSRKLLAARDRVRRTSAGITNMPSSQESNVEEDDRSSMPPPPVPDTPRQRQRKPRKSGRHGADDAVLETLSKTSASGARRSSSKHSRQSDTDTEAELPRPAVRRPRKSEATPKMKLEEPEDTPVRPQMPSSAFSDENPFQSGSSPLTIEATRRRSAGTSSERKKSSSNRRRTGGVTNGRFPGEQTDGAVVPTSKTFEMPVSSLKKFEVKKESDEGVEAGEEFTPEEQLELVRQRAVNGESNILLPRRRRTYQKSGNVPKSLPWMLLAALLGGYATWYRQEKLAVGYCGIGRPSESVAGVEIPDWAGSLQPNCEPCPQHAICYENLETKCERDFIVQPHPLSFGGLVPLPPTCEPDGEKVRKVKAVADRAVEELRERKAQSECGIITDAKGKAVSPEIAEQDLKQEVSKKRRRGMTEAEFEELWKGAIGEVVGREEVSQSPDKYVDRSLSCILAFLSLIITHVSFLSPNVNLLPCLTSSSTNQILRGDHRTRLGSKSLVRLPITCAIKRSARLTLARYRGALSLIVLVFGALIYVRNRILQKRSDAVRIPNLIAITLDRLATQAALYSRGDARDSWISVGQLRDDILREEFNDRRREAMWTRVRDVVEKNANVRASSRELRGGDMSRVWEWIGSIGLLDDPGFSGRKSGAKRVSWGGTIDNGESRERPSPSGLGGGDQSQRTSEQRKWDEGRPIY